MPGQGRTPDFELRDAEARDLGQITDIYGHHVREGLGSFEEAPPDLAEMTRRFEALRARGMPYVVAEDAAAAAGKEILGYAYCGPYRPRPAYRFTLENSVYVSPRALRRGVGAALLKTLIERSEALGCRQLVAVIGDSGNTSSIGLHEAHGFKRAGLLASVGYKHGRWVDVVLLQRALGPGDRTPPDEP